MAALSLSLNLDNDAFVARDGTLEAPEVARCLRHAALRVINGETEGRLLDRNGNPVGMFKIEGLQPPAAVA